MPGMQITWKVTSTSPTQEFGPNGSPIQGHTVNFTTSTGYEGSVFVPDDVWADASKVKDVIRARAIQAATIKNLEGTVTV